MFDGWIETFTNLLQNPFFLILGVVLAVIIIWGLVKKLFKLALIVLAAFVIYIAYLIWTGQDIPTSLDGVKDSVQETISSSKENADETKEGLEEAAKEKVEKTLMEKIEDFFTGGDD
jgi:hypothetical protein